MKARFLLPHRLKWLGWLLLIPGLALGLYYMIGSDILLRLDVRVPDFFGSENAFSGSAGDGSIRMIKNNLADEISLSLILLGVLILLLAAEKHEDEMIMKLRLESLLWAAIVNAILIFLTIWLVYDFAFFTVMIVNMVLFYLLFIIRFNWVLWRFKALGNEEQG